MSTVLELAERCEKASGANQMLDEAIYETLAIEPSREHSFVYPHYAFTASLDAAMTLVPGNRGSLRFLTIEHDAHDGARWVARLDSDGDECGHGETIYCEANTAALALCAAALRAIAAGTRSAETNEKRDAV